MNLLTKIIFITLTLNTPSFALKLNEPLPLTPIVARGELLLINEKIEHKAWSSKNSLTSKPTIIYHVAARRAADAGVNPIMDSIRKNLSSSSYTSITIVNTSNVLWGTSKLVSIGMAENKKENPSWHIISDDSGAVKRDWNLNQEDVAIIILDKHGIVKYFINTLPDPKDRKIILTLLNSLVSND